MHVLHVIATGSRRGGEIFASDLIRALDGWGVRQDVGILHGPEEHALDLPVPATALSRDGTATSRRRFDIPLLKSVRQLITALRPDVVQAHGGEALKYVVASSLRPPPIVYRRIGAAIPQVRRGFRRRVFSAQMAKAARVVAVSEAVRNETLDVFRIPAEKIVTIPNAVDRGRLRTSRDAKSIRREVGVGEHARVLTFLGAFTWEKDPLANLEITLGVLDEVTDAVVVMVGDGPLRPQVEAIRRTHPLASRVVLLGSRPDVGNLLSITDVLVSASKTEGMPANIIEAGMAGVPVAAYALSGIPEIIVNHETGILATAGDKRALVEGVVSLLQDEEARAAMGRSARARCRDLFDIEPVARRYLSVYQEVSPGRHPPNASGR